MNTAWLGAFYGVSLKGKNEIFWVGIVELRSLSAQILLVYGGSNNYITSALRTRGAADERNARSCVLKQASFRRGKSFFFLAQHVSKVVCEKFAMKMMLA